MATISANIEAALASGCPPLAEWLPEGASFEPDGRTLRADAADERYLLGSPPFEIEGRGYACARVDFDLFEDGPIGLGGLDVETQSWLGFTVVEPGGRPCVTVAWPQDGRATIALVLFNRGGRVRFRPSAVAFSFAAPLPPPEHWTLAEGGAWQPDGRLAIRGRGALEGLVSQPFRIAKNHLVACGLDYLLEGHANTYLLVREIGTRKVLARRILSKSGDFRTAVTLKATADTEVELVLSAMGEAAFEFTGFGVHDYSDDDLAWLPPDAESAAPDTALAHWNRLQRAIHERCKRSRGFNALVSSIEMRLGREEVLSLPSYFAICPTGQCNALCAFCSVTINRTGIIKKQLPLDQVGRFLQPMARTIELYGLEGNGEPTLHSQFRRLVQTLTNDGSKVYLISNGSRLTPELIRLLMHDRIDSVNFSLNAASGPTHRQVMKLRHFDQITDNIRALARGRGEGAGWGKSPIVSISLVVTADNIHEVADFLRLGEQRLEVDRIYIRPLSELGNELGTVEDLRGLEPTESAVRDMLDGVADYLAATPRRAVVYVNPDNFRAVRPDPSGDVYRPRGFEDRLLAPRGRYWTTLDPSLRVRWGFDRVRVTGSSSAAPVLLESAPIPVVPGEAQTLTFDTWSAHPTVTLCACGAEGKVLAELLLPARPEGETEALSLAVTPDDGFVTLQLRHAGGAVDFEIVFPRLMSPGPVVRARPALPPAHRWALDAPEVRVAWQASQLSLKGTREPGLYIIKSYAAPCAPDTDVALEIEVLVRAGQLGIGILNEASEVFLTSAMFEPGFHETTIAFASGTNRAFRAVLYAVNGPDVDAIVDWQGGITPSPGGGPPPAPLRSHVALVPLAPAPAPPAMPVALTIELDDRPAHIAEPAPAGRLARVAHLARRKWRTLLWVLGRPRRVPHVARSKLGHHRQVLRRKWASAKWVFSDPSRPRHWAYSKYVYAGEKLRAAARRRPAAGWLHRLLFGRPRYYCQKPWTDMANFTVDGRVDVCCIATGASQEAFALGNLTRQSFQEVWNGAKARTFRRTVNSAEPLPPCRRCPMAYGYQGRFFDRAYTLDWIGNDLIGAKLLGWARGFRGARLLQYVVYHPLRLALYAPIYLLCNLVFFRGFRR